MSKKAAKASRENGKKGGRPKGFAALEAERQRAFVAEKLVTAFEPIVDKAIEQAKKGDKYAREWLANRAFGKPLQTTELTGKDGESLFNNEQKEKADKAIGSFMDKENA